MKEFACGDVVPGCSAKFKAPSDDEVLKLVAKHAHEDHGLTEVTPELVKAVREHIHSA